MPDTGDNKSDSLSATLDASAEITREAIARLVSSALPTSISLDGREIAIESAVVGTRARVTLRWPRGSMRLRIGLTTATNERSNVEDRGHRQSLQAWSEEGSREVAWVGFEWFVRDAIREGRSTVPVMFWTSFMERGAAEEETGIGNAELGRRARELLGRAGLGDQSRIQVGHFDLASRTWAPDPSTVLQRVIVIAAVKTILRDRGRGRLIEGEAPFTIRVPATQASAALPPSPEPGPKEKLTGVHLWYGPGAQQVEGVREALRFVAEENPTTPALEKWIRDKGDLAHSRIDIYTRPLLQLGLAHRDEDDHWSLTERGAALVESTSADLLFDAFVSHYVGFEEALAFYGRHPEGKVEDLLVDLNFRVGTGWTVTAQPNRRAQWLRAMGLLDGARGAWTLSARGREVFNALPAAFRSDVAAEPPPPDGDGGEDEPQPARLVSDDVPLGDLQLDADIISRCVAALNAGKHILLVGPPGTGKSAIGNALAKHAADVFGLKPPVLATASADWTAYDTIGGWTQRADQRLTFRPGVLTRAIGERRWLVLDELNRADVDKCLGEAFTVLAGGEAETAFTHDDGSVVRIGPGSPYDPGDWFRMIATMNVRDKATLFRLSYALLRRFAIVEIPAPGDALMRTIALADAKRLGLDHGIAELVAAVFTRDKGLGAAVELGPAMLRDVLAYVKQRGASDLAVAEGLDLFVFAQLNGLEAVDAKRAHGKLADLFHATEAARGLALRRFAAYFPHVRFDG